MLGSCFAANMGERLLRDGYDICLNPFGTLFNPASVASSIRRLDSGRPFTEDECVMMGSGAGLWCSFSHYTRFARADKAEFLENANAALAEASAFFHSCSSVIVTFGTSYVFRNREFAAGSEKRLDGIVSNCLKLPAREFERFRLSVDEIVELWKPLLEGPLAGKKVLFTVSPIRHLADSAHGNQLSKATLLLAIDKLLENEASARTEAALPASGRERDDFPSYEIVLDELRDYSWYAEDTVHPSADAIDLIYGRFAQYCLQDGRG